MQAIDTLDIAGRGFWKDELDFDDDDDDNDGDGGDDDAGADDADSAMESKLDPSLFHYDCMSEQTHDTSS